MNTLVEFRSCASPVGARFQLLDWLGFFGSVFFFFKNSVPRLVSGRWESGTQDHILAVHSVVTVTTLAENVLES
jgi:hypothetical protein